MSILESLELDILGTVLVDTNGKQYGIETGWKVSPPDMERWYAEQIDTCETLGGVLAYVMTYVEDQPVLLFLEAGEMQMMDLSEFENCK